MQCNRYKFLEDDIKETNNNGLEYTVAVLENLYTDPDFPNAAQPLEASLKSTGKSRYGGRGLVDNSLILYIALPQS